MSSFVELQNNINGDESENGDEKPRRYYRNRCMAFLCSRIVTGTFFLIIFSVTIPVLIFFILFHIGYSAKEQRHTCLVESSYRVSCGKPNITAEGCAVVQCCFDEETEQCFHYVPSLYYYRSAGDSEMIGYYYASRDKTPFDSSSIDTLAVSVVEIDENKLRVVLHRSNISVETNRMKSTKSYDVKIYDEDYLYVQVTRENTEDVLFTTHKGPLIASAGYWEWTFQLTTDKLFGLGEMNFKENTTYTKVIYKNKDDHNTLPIFMAYLNGKYHGAVVEHEGPLEVTVLPSYLIILRSIIGDNISITISTGPTPADVVRQQRVAQPAPLPFWALGPHLCRKAGDNLTAALEHYYGSLENMNGLVQYASDCFHEHFVFLLHNANDTFRENVTAAVDEIRTRSRFVLSFQPQVEISENPLYEAAVKYNLLYKDIAGQPLNGSYKGTEVAFVDFSLAETDSYFDTLLETTLEGIKYDGVVFTDNWPAEDTYIMKDHHTFPFISEEMNASISQTIPWDAISGHGEQHITKHNSYATAQLQHFEKALDENSFLMTASYNYEVEHAALIQDIDISWESLRKSIRTILYHNMFANSLISIPVCGSTENFVEESHDIICMRWYIMAATSPLLRISSTLPFRDPDHLVTGYVKNTALKALAERRKLSLYLHSVLKSREPLMRPLFYDFCDDNNTLTLDSEYMVGPALLATQILLPEVNTISLYLPPSAGVWFEYFGGGSYTELGWRLFSVVESDWLLFIPQGQIIPLINSNGNEATLDTIALAIALNCSDANSCYSEGKLRYNLVEIGLTADTERITIINADTAASDIECGAGDIKWPTVVESAVVYGLSENLVEVHFDPVDLCDIIDNQYTIRFYTNQSQYV